MKAAHIFLLGIIILIAGIIIGFIIDKPQGRIIVEERIDTLVVRDTLRLPPPPPKIIYLDSIETITLPSIIEKDTVYVEVQVPIGRKIYETSDYRAIIEGFKPSLVSMDIYRRTEYINRVETIKIPDKKRWGIGIQAGYGVGIKNGEMQLMPYIGIGVQWDIIRW